MKRLFLALATILLCGGCGGDRGPTVRFWHIQTYDPTKPAVSAAVERYRAAHPDVTVEVTPIANDAFKEKLRNSIAAGDVPDVFHSWGGGGLRTFADNRLVLPLDGRVANLDRFHPAALDICRVDGKLHALPVDLTAVPMWYNRDLFAKHNVAIPQTYEELLAACETFRAAGITPIALGNNAKWTGAFFFIYLATRNGGMTAIQARDFEAEAFVVAGRQLQEMVNKGCFSTGFNGRGDDDARREFFNGEAAMMLMGSWLLAKAKTEAPEFLDQQLGCFAFPGLGEDPRWDAAVVGGVNAGYAVSAKCPYPDQAVGLLEALTADQALEDWAKTGRIPALPRASAQPLLGPESTLVAEILWAAPVIQLYYDQLLSPPLAEAHKDTTQQLFALTMSPEEAAAKMAEVAAKTP